MHTVLRNTHAIPLAYGIFPTGNLTFVALGHKTTGRIAWVGMDTGVSQDGNARIPRPLKGAFSLLN
jgi:hypothetical protein